MPQKHLFIGLATVVLLGSICIGIWLGLKTRTPAPPITTETQHISPFYPFDERPQNLPTSATHTQSIALSLSKEGFSPNSISGREYDTLALTLAPTPFPYHFEIPKLGISLAIEANQETNVTLPRMRAERYNFLCTDCPKEIADPTGVIFVSPL